MDAMSNQTENTYVVSVSSLHPIDLASIIMYHVYNPLCRTDSVRVFIDEDVELPNENSRRILTPRLALQTPLLLLDSNDTYRQVFLPLFPDKQDFNLHALLQSLHLVLDNISSRIDSSSAEDIKHRIDQIYTYFATHPTFVKKPGSFLAEIVRYLFRDILGHDVIVDLQVPLLHSTDGQHSCLKALQALAYEILHDLGERKFVFSKGGYIRATRKNDRSFQLRFNNGKVIGNRIIFWDLQHNASLELVINSDEPQPIVSHCGIQFTDILIDLSGPLTVIFQGQFGTNMDVPWYCEKVSPCIQPWSVCTGVEPISPISACAQERVSVWAGGQGVRVTPSGYSLLDFDSSNVRAYIASVTGLVSANHSDFDDWRHLINNYPLMKQKALKHQGGVKEYCQLRLSDIRNQIKAESVEPIKRLEASLDIPHLGAKMLSCMAILKYMADCLATSKVQWTEPQVRVLEQLGFMRHGDPVLGSTSALVTNLIENSSRWRNMLAKPQSVLTGLDTDDPIQMVQYIAEQRFTSEYEIIPRENQTSSIHLRKSFRMLQDEVTLYYKIVLALSASILKANIWTNWVLLGGEEYNDLCQDILSKRDDSKILHLSMQLWKNEL